MKKIMKKVQQIVAIVLIVALLPISDYAQVFAYEKAPDSTTSEYPYSHEIATQTSSGNSQPGEAPKEDPESILGSVSTNSGNTINADGNADEISDNTTEIDSISISMNADISDDHQFMLEWEDSTISSNHFEVYRNDKLVQTSPDKKFIEKNIEWGTTYRYYVVAKDQSGQIISKSDVAEFATAETLEYNGAELSIPNNTILKSGYVKGLASLRFEPKCKLVVLEDFTCQKDGILYNTDADIICGGDFVLESGAVISDGSDKYDKNKEISSSIKVNGNLIWNTREGEKNDRNNCLTYTTLVLNGNFTNYISDNQLEFNKMILSGKDKQEVNLQNSLNFTKTLEILNTSEEGVHFSNLPEFESFKGNADKVYENEKKVSVSSNTVLSEDEVIEGDYHLYGGTLDLKGHTFHITGNFYQEGGDVVLNKGQLIVDEQYIMRDLISDNNYLPTLATLTMSEPEDYIIISRNLD